MEQTQTNYTVGQQVYIVRSGSWECHYSKGTVTKVTPAGAVDVKVGDSDPIRFRDGQSVKQGFSRAGAYWLDKVTIEEREAALAKEQRSKEAVAKIRAIEVHQVRHQWGKDSLMEEVNRLQAQLDAARAAVEAI